VDESLSQQDLLVDYLADDLFYGEDLDLGPSLDGVEDRSLSAALPKRVKLWLPTLPRFNVSMSRLKIKT
jgi:hypothetical protein